MEKIKDFISIFRSQPKNSRMEEYEGLPLANMHGNPFRSSVNSYSSAFSNVRPIENEFMQVRPFAIDSNGKPVAHYIIDVLNKPNKNDSNVEFRRKLASSILYNRKTYLLAWRNEGGKAVSGNSNFRSNKIAAFTFLERPSISKRSDEIFYSIGSNEYTENEVLVIPGGVDPTNLYGGYSPAIASQSWRNIDDCVADFQLGFFNNNAVPEGLMTVLARTVKDFNDIVDSLETANRGSRNSGKIHYAHQPMSREGTPQQPQLIFTPFAHNNTDSGAIALLDKSEKRIDTNYGTSGVVKGIDDAATYANAEVAEAGFAKRTVKPLLLLAYSQLTHELNRITGGLGVAITFEYEIPAIADAEKTKAEVLALHNSLISSLETQGYSLDSIVDAFGLPHRYKLLKKGTVTPVINNDKPEVDEGGESEGLPSAKVGGSASTTLKFKNLSEDEQYEMRFENALNRFMLAKIDESIAGLPKEETVKNELEENEEEGDPEPTPEETLLEELVAISLALLVLRGAVGFSEAEQMIGAAGGDTSKLTQFIATKEIEDTYRGYLTKVATSYGDDTAKSIQSVLVRAQAEGWGRSQTSAELRNIMKTDSWRIDRLANTEVHRTNTLAKIYAASQAQEQSGVSIEKGIEHSGGDAPCEFCQALLDKWTPVDVPMLGLNQVLIGSDGGIFINSFSENMGYDVHPNGHCRAVFRVAK